MFTGIVEDLAPVQRLERDDGAARLWVRAPELLVGTQPGDSIAVNGCCLTVAEHDGQVWRADMMAATLAATTLGVLAAGEMVNVERAVRLDGRLGGHWVQGHIDGVAVVVSREPGPAWTTVRVALDPGTPEGTGLGECPGTDPASESRTPHHQAQAGLSRYVVPRGSIALDGVSLTVVDVEADVITVGLIPETLRRTTLGARQVGDWVNVEVDILAKYVERLLPTSRRAGR